jgi:hypothetical protein
MWGFFSRTLIGFAHRIHDVYQIQIILCMLLLRKEFKQRILNSALISSCKVGA